MTSVADVHPTATPNAPAPMDARHLLRLRLKPKALPTGYLDGGWWPRSGDLLAELPTLAEVLAVRLGAVIRVMYPMGSWDAAPRRVDVAGQSVRLEGFHSQDPHVVYVSGPDRQRISLLVVPPAADAGAAHEALMTASGRGNADRPADILTAAGVLGAEAAPRPGSAGDATERWEIDGGRVAEPA